ncbi:MAG: 2-amino-4-hydroxy-6-hydroxymethyldihydropteridine diphosphokinase [Acidobacteria bacterium]|nr:2-amino-4-hydroxy-6-hydroxymethyldihydropteridine diphosphokinase [Acidobacteriota bacterium]
MRTSPAILVALGSNVDAATNIRRAAELLRSRLDVVATSRVYESPPVGAPRTPAFLNAVVRIVSPLGPRTIKFEILRAIESLLGRRRCPDRSAPRTIDLDLVLFGQRVETSPDLVLPDPDLLACAHVAVPAAEVAPEIEHPLTGNSLAEIAAALASDLIAHADIVLL